MMKKILPVILIVFAVMMVFTGCVRVRRSVKVDIFGNISERYEMLYSGSLASLGVSETDFEGLIGRSVDELEEMGYTCERYSENGYEGLILTKEGFSAPDDDFMNIGTLQKDGLNYVIDIPVDIHFEDMIPQNYAEQLSNVTSLISANGGYMELVVELPFKPVSHNATSVSKDGKTLTWNLLDMGDRTSVHVEYYVLPPFLLWVAIGAAVLILAAVVIVIIVLVKKAGRRRKATEERKSAEEIARAEENANSADDMPEVITLEKLRVYKTMLDEGLISQEDYEKKKNDFLALSEKEDAPAEE